MNPNHPQYPSVCVSWFIITLRKLDLISEVAHAYAYDVYTSGFWTGRKWVLITVQSLKSMWTSISLHSALSWRGSVLSRPDPLGAGYFYSEAEMYNRLMKYVKWRMEWKDIWPTAITSEIGSTSGMTHLSRWCSIWSLSSEHLELTLRHLNLLDKLSTTD